MNFLQRSSATSSGAGASPEFRVSRHKARRTVYLGYLACVRCGNEVEEDEAFGGCGRCAAEGVPANVLPVYDLSRVAGSRPDPASRGLFRYRDLLPIASWTRPVSLSEGGTPLVPLGQLGQEFGVSKLYLKDESRNPTWSYKDRLAAVAVTKAVEKNADTVVAASTGNHGAAVAAYAAVAGLRCIVLIPESAPPALKTMMQFYGATVVALRDGPEPWRLVEKLVQNKEWVPMSNYSDPPVGSNPFGVEGYKTIAYEVVEGLGAVPDVVVVPAACGDGLAGILRGFEDLMALGETSSVPRLVAAEPLGPYSNALVRNLETSDRLKFRRSVAFSTATPMGTYQGLEAIRRSGGTAVAIPDDELILAAQALAARVEGVFLEASAAVGLPAVRRLAEHGKIDGEAETVVLIGTSTGLKDVEPPAKRLSPVRVIEPDLASLDRALGGDLP
jgi:threonine synthase